MGQFQEDKKGELQRDFGSNLVRVSMIPPQIFYREALIRETLYHPNILKLIGVDVKERLLITVSEWMVHGNIMEYIANNETSRLGLVRCVVSPRILSLKTAIAAWGSLRSGIPPQPQPYTWGTQRGWRLFASRAIHLNG